MRSPALHVLGWSPAVSSCFCSAQDTLASALPRTRLPLLLGESSFRVPTLCVFFANPESPLQFYVNYPNSGSASAYGPGLVYGVANKTATFTIVTEDAGEGTVVLGYRRV